MRIAREFDFSDLVNECWDCEDVLKAISDNNVENVLMDLLEEVVFKSEVPTLTEVNDLLRFDGDWVLKTLGIDTYYEEEENEDNVEEE